MGIKFHYGIKSEVQNSLKEKFDDDKFKISNDRKKCLCRDEKHRKFDIRASSNAKIITSMPKEEDLKE